jgi:hypothetical protein
MPVARARVFCHRKENKATVLLVKRQLGEESVNDRLSDAVMLS